MDFTGRELLLSLVVVYFGQLIFCYISVKLQEKKEQ